MSPATPAAQIAAQGQLRTLTYWGGPDTQDDAKRKQKFLEDQGYFKGHPNVKLEVGVIPGVPEFWSKLLTSLAGGTPPDVCRFKEAFTQHLAWKKSLLDVTPYMQKSGVKPGDFITVALDQLSYKGGIYGLPWEMYVIAQFMNRDLYKKAGLAEPNGEPKPPANLGEWREQQKTIQKSLPKGGYAFKYNEYSTREWNLMYFNQWLVSAGGTFWTDLQANKIGINSEAGQKAMQFFVDMIYEDKTSEPPEGTTASDTHWRNVYNGLIATWHTGQYSVNALKKQAPNVEIALGLLPKDVRYAHATLVDGHGIIKSTKVPDDAWDLVNWWASPEIDLEWRKLSPTLPGRKETLTKPLYANDPTLAFFAKLGAREDNVPRPFAEGWDEMATAVATELQAGFFKKKSVKEALDAAKEAGEAVVAKARKEG